MTPEEKHILIKGLASQAGHSDGLTGSWPSGSRTVQGGRVSRFRFPGGL